MAMAKAFLEKNQIVIWALVCKLHTSRKEPNSRLSACMYDCTFLEKNQQSSGRLYVRPHLAEIELLFQFQNGLKQFLERSKKSNFQKVLQID
jgi:hypothetical protein